MTMDRVAVAHKGGTRHGFLVSVSEEVATVRFLNPYGWKDAEVSLKDILGVHGKTYFSSCPDRPEICERVTFVDHGRERKGWVLDVECNGKVILLVEIRFHYLAGSEVLPEEGGIEHITEERWVEELILTPLGAGWSKNGEVGERPENGAQPVSASPPASNRRPVDLEKKGGGPRVPVATVQRVVDVSRRLAEIRTARKSWVS